MFSSVVESAGVTYNPPSYVNAKTISVRGTTDEIVLESDSCRMALKSGAATVDGHNVLTDKNIHEQDLAVMGVANANKKADAHAPGLVRQGDPDGSRFLSEAGLWGYPSEHTGVVTEHFVTLQDAPSSYQSNHGKFVRVHETEDKLEFVDLSTVPLNVGALQVGGVPEEELPAGGTTSDENAKQEITDVDMEECVGVLRSINPVSFRYKSDPAKKHVGVLAQELQRLFPDAVIEGGEYLKVSYMELVGLLVATSKSLIQRVDALEAKVDALAGLIRLKNNNVD